MNRVFFTLLFLLSFWALCSATEKLDSMLVRGDSSIAIEWTPDSTNTRADWYVKYGSGCSGADTIYRHCDFLPGVTYHSIAYSYGGEDSFVRFREKVESGFLIGSHMCHYNNYGDPSDTVAGTDCSGFVCYLWDVPRVSTGVLHSKYKVITREDLAVGDILVKPGSHAVLVVEREDDTHFLIWESTSAVNGCRERTIDISDSYWDAYAPRRYEGLTMHAEVPQRSVVRKSGPFVRCFGNRIIFAADKAWNGTVSAFSISGKRLFTTEVAIAENGTFSYPVDGISGVYIVRMSSIEGTDVTTGLTVTRQ